MSSGECGCGCSCGGTGKGKSAKSVESVKAVGSVTATRVDGAIAESGAWLAVARALDGGDGETANERAERTRLFEIPGACPPYEAAWIRRDKGAILADLAGFYRAFGFDAAQESGVRHDHLGAIAEYLALVRIMEARALEAGNAEAADVALEAGNAEAADVALEAYVNCLRDHLADWISPFCTRLRASTMSQPMLRAADLIEHAWGSTVAHGLPSFDQLDAVGAPDMGPETPYECGMASESDGFTELTASAASASSGAGALDGSTPCPDREASAPKGTAQS